MRYSEIQIYILSIMLNTIEKVQEIYKNANREELRNLISKNIIPSIEEKNKNAEVPTPVRLVNEMLNIIPIEFWQTPKKVFEPCCGKGNFVLGIFDKFYEGLEKSIPDKKERCKTIMSHCLYFGDITPLNVFVTSEILKCHIKYYSGLDVLDSFNTYIGDTLAMNIEELKVSSFDAVIGNPPYNKSKEFEVKGGYGGRSLWGKFVEHALNKLLVKNGYLLYVHPPSWRKPGHKLWKIMSSKQLIYLKSLTEKEGRELFGCPVSVDYYLLENVHVHKDTKFNGQDGKEYLINLSELNFLPSGCVNEIKDILGKNKVVYSRSLYGTDKKNVSMNKMENFNLPIVHSMTKKRGLGFVYSNEDKGQFKVPKVILSFGRHQYPYNDWKGEYGMSQICYGLEITSEDEGEKMINALNSEKFKEILMFTKWSTFLTDWRMFEEFKKDFWKEFV
jgi:hypothetical protein